ncbi:hypothetical protein DJ030_11335 [bacterium endosymbiont of Escarpia laminata]|nr:MAG: hypothetical protein DJ030_11335 [bacterium endosymbiont of Escarpia laminata]
MDVFIAKGSRTHPLAIIKEMISQAPHVSLIFLSVIILSPICLTAHAAPINCVYLGGSNTWSSSSAWTGIDCASFYPNNENGGDTFNATVNSGVVTLDQDIAIQQFNFGGGIVTGSHNFTAHDSLRISGGTLSGSGTTRAEGGLRLNGTSDHYINDTQTLVNASGQTAEWTDTTSSTYYSPNHPGDIRMASGARLVNESGATFNATRTSSGSLHSRSITGGSFDNQGTFNVDVGSSDNVYIRNAFSNTGTVNVNSGRLWVSGSGTLSSGSFNLTGGDLFVSGTHTFDGGTSITGSRTATFTGTNTFDDATLSQATASFGSGLATVGANTTYDVGNTYIRNGATVDFAATGLRNLSLYSGGLLRSDNTVAVSGQFNLNGGTLSGSGTTRAEGGLRLNGTSDHYINDTQTLVNASGQTAEWTDTTSSTYYSPNHPGDIRMASGARLVNESGATFNATRTSSGSLHSRSITGGSFDNQGTFNVDVGSSDNVYIRNAFSNTGTVNVNSGNLRVSGTTTTNSGKVTIDSGASLIYSNTYELTSGHTSVNGRLIASGGVKSDGGLLSGSGLIYGDVTNGGFLNPGNSPGRLTINGNYEQDSTGVLLIELLGENPGIEYDQLIVNGLVDLNSDGGFGGILDLDLAYDALVGDIFTIILNDSTDLISNVFSGLVEGALLYEEFNDFSYEFGITYQGGTGNDVVISILEKTFVPSPSSIWLFLAGLLGLIAVRRKNALST